MNKRKRKVLERWPEAYAYKAAPYTWRINVEQDGVLITLGTGRTAAQAWLIAATVSTPQKEQG